MHHVYDETPDEVFKQDSLPTVEGSHAIYATHVGKTLPTVDKEQVDTSQYRQRGYRVGSLVTGPDDPDGYYKQPGHPLSDKADKGGRFKVINSNGIFSFLQKIDYIIILLLRTTRV